MALPSQELLEKYRAEEKADKGAPANPEQTNAEKTETQTTETPTGAQGGEGDGAATTPTETTPSASAGEDADKSAKGDDRWEHAQSQWKKRLDRQERAHRKQIAGLEATIAELKKQVEGNKPKLQREDFPTVEAYESYKNEEQKKQLLDELEKSNAAKEAAARQQAEAKKKMEATFKTPEAQRDFQDTMSDFIDDNSEWLETEEGQLYQEIIDQSPVGLVMAMAIAKNDAVQEQMKKWSKDLLYQKLASFEVTLMNKAKEAKNATAAKQTTPAQPAEKAPSTSGIPSTGSVGKTQAPQTFNAKDWLRKNRPERYPR